MRDRQRQTDRKYNYRTISQLFHPGVLCSQRGLDGTGKVRVWSLLGKKSWRKKKCSSKMLVSTFLERCSFMIGFVLSFTQALTHPVRGVIFFLFYPKTQNTEWHRKYYFYKIFVLVSDTSYRFYLELSLLYWRIVLTLYCILS